MASRVELKVGYTLHLAGDHTGNVVKSKCFEPIARADARVLILGSLPGQMSLARGEYYAQPYNSFWRIMGELVGASRDVPYRERLELLEQHHIAVWEVCAAGFRAGSLDSAIDLATVRVNNFGAFLRAHPGISLICFNGRKAEEIFNRKVRQEPRAVFDRIRYASLPSTSAAHAGMPFAQKLARWRNALAGTVTRVQLSRVNHGSTIALSPKRGEGPELDHVRL